MRPVEGTWLKGPALKILLMMGGLHVGDFVKLGGHFGTGAPKWGIVVPKTAMNGYVRDTTVMLANGDLYLVHPHSIRAWMRKPLDLEL